MVKDNGKIAPAGRWYFSRETEVWHQEEFSHSYEPFSLPLRTLNRHWVLSTKLRRWQGVCLVLILPRSHTAASVESPSQFPYWLGLGEN